MLSNLQWRTQEEKLSSIWEFPVILKKQSTPCVGIFYIVDRRNLDDDNFSHICK